MKPFWRKEPFTASEWELMAALAEAHHSCTFRQCPSTVAVGMAAKASGDYYKAIASGLLQFGGLHGPLVETQLFLENERIVGVAEQKLARKEIIPGWGTSFVKGKLDPALNQVDEVLRRVHPELYARIATVTGILHRAGKVIYPNPSAYTAATAITIGLPAKLCPWLLVSQRLIAWSEVFLKNL